MRVKEVTRLPIILNFSYKFGNPGRFIRLTADKQILIQVDDTPNGYFLDKEVILLTMTHPTRKFFFLASVGEVFAVSPGLAL